MNRMSNRSCNCSIAVGKWMLFAAALWTASAQAQQVELRADTTALKLGGQTWIHLQTVRDPAQTASAFEWPVLKDTLPGGWEILEMRPADTSLVPLDDGRDAIAITRSLRVTTWDSGLVRMPALPFVLDGDTLLSNPVLFAVASPALGDEGQIANFHDIVEVDWTLAERLRRIIPWILAALALAGLAWAAMRWWKNRERQADRTASEPEKPREPAHVIALRTLREIQERAVWKQGNPKGHQSAISLALRTYLEDRFDVPALEQTTGDIARTLRSVAIDPDLRRQFVEVLELADLVKFAKYRGDAAEHERAVRRAIELVERTRPVADESPSAS